MYRMPVFENPAVFFSSSWVAQVFAFRGICPSGATRP
jgi:hypothetical protein